MTKEEARLGLRLLKIEQLLHKGARCYKLAYKMIRKMGLPIHTSVRRTGV